MSVATSLSCGHNLIGSPGTTGFTDGVNGNHVGTSASPLDPLLGPLALYGGPTMTHGLLQGSTAINAGHPSPFEPTDQRGVVRLGLSDIGAFEARPVAVAFCTPGTTTNGCVPSINSSGTPSASAVSGFTITVNTVEGQKQGLIFYGIDNAGFEPIPWGPSTSYACVKPATQRMVRQNSGGTLNACKRMLSIDWNAYRAAHPAALGAPFAGGDYVWAQAWFRDPPSPKHAVLSGALCFRLAP